MSLKDFSALGVVVLACFVAGAFGDAMEECHARNKTYFIADSTQCDKYWECSTKAALTERMCEDGFVYKESTQFCDYPHNVKCGERKLLQPSQSKDKNCERSNGFYPFPPAISCQKFYHCLEGVAYEKTCPDGIIFDPETATCTHPDLARRSECTASTVLNFKCPNMNERYSRLRFGDHDRHAHPTDCRKFFICLMDGKPRLGGCPIGKVFNPKTGFCDSAKNVQSCKEYYGNKMDKLSAYDINQLEKMGEEFHTDADAEGDSSEETGDKPQKKPQGKESNSKDANSPSANLV